MTTGMIAKGWAINTEYFAEVMHALRDDLTYSAVVDAMIDFPSNADKRHMTAIKRLCTAFLKLLFPHVQTPNDIGRQEFIDYCLIPLLKCALRSINSSASSMPRNMMFQASASLRLFANNKGAYS